MNFKTTFFLFVKFVFKNTLLGNNISLIYHHPRYVWRLFSFSCWVGGTVAFFSAKNDWRNRGVLEDANLPLLLSESWPSLKGDEFIWHGVFPMPTNRMAWSQGRMCQLVSTSCHQNPQESSAMATKFFCCPKSFSNKKTHTTKQHGNCGIIVGSRSFRGSAKNLGAPTWSRVFCLSATNLCQTGPAGDTIAMSSCQVNEVQATSIVTEIRHLAACEHPNILCLLGTFSATIRPRNYLVLALEYCNTGPLSEYVSTSGHLDLITGQVASVSLLSGIAYLHSKQIYHRDLRPQNILLDLKGKEIRYGHFKNPNMGDHTTIFTLSHAKKTSPILEIPYVPWVCEESRNLKAFWVILIVSCCFFYQSEKKQDKVRWSEV